MARESKGLKLQYFVRGRLRELAPSLNLEVYDRALGTIEYPYNFPDIKGRRPSCDIAISDNENLFLIEIESKGTPTWNAVKVWYYIKHGGRFDEWKSPKEVYILHFVSEKIRDYDFRIAKDLGNEIEKISKTKLKRKGLHLEYGTLERFKINQKGMEEVAEELSQKIIDKIKKLRKKLNHGLPS